MVNCNILSLPTYADQRGCLTVLNSLLPFEIKRVYWIYGSDGQIRGEHRHRMTRQALIAISGEITIFMDDGINQSLVHLNKPNTCLLVEPKDWHSMSFGPGSILLALASHEYDPNDYIHERYEKN